MSSTAAKEVSIPKTPVPSKEFVSYLAEHPNTPVRELLKPFTEYEDALRRVFATQPEHEEIQDPFANLVPLFGGNEDLRIRARDLENESEKEKQNYIMPLKDEERKENGEMAIVDKQEFMKNFAIFSESALQNLDWTNIVVAGSSVLTPLLPVPEKHKQNKKTLREYYHNILAPTSDVDVFIYGANEEEAYQRMIQIEATVKDNLLWEVTSVRTKHTITIVSRYPNRHVQIVLRLYKSVSEILTGFDVNCSCVAFDGKQVYASPRAIASLITQSSEIDLNRRSPSYEYRLAKYRSRGFEVYYPHLKRENIDPTIFERNFGRLQGLARLLVLEKLPSIDKRESYVESRRSERGNPKPNYMKRMPLKGDLKADAEVADWDFEAEEAVASYHTFTIPYGQMHNAKKTEKLLFTKDMLLNAEWNKQAQKARPAYLHRHPVFIGTVEQISKDCCGFCPVPETEEEKELQAEDDKIYIRGPLTWLKDEPGRQEIGSFYPVTEGEWTEMAYVGVNQKLFSAIVMEDVEAVKKYLDEEGYDPNRRDIVGRTPLHVACLCSSVEVVQVLIDKGARLISRLSDGRTALHVAAARGDEAICRALLNKSEENEAKKLDALDSGDEETSDKDKKKDKEEEKEDEEDEDENEDEDEDYEEVSSNPDTTASFITGTDSYMKKKERTDVPLGIPDDVAETEEDIIDIDITDWNNRFTPLHYAIIGNHTEVVRLLISDFGADVMLPVKLVNDWDGSARAAILSLTLVLSLPTSEQRTAMAELLLSLGATTAQADLKGNTVINRCIYRNFTDVLKTLLEKDKATTGRIINLIKPQQGYYYSRNSNDTVPLISAIKINEEAALLLLENGAKPSISLEEWYKAKNAKGTFHSEDVEKQFYTEVEQPIMVALQYEAIETVLKLLDMGVDPSTMDTITYKQRIYVDSYGSIAYNMPGTVIDLVRRKLTLLDRAIKEEEEYENAENAEKYTDVSKNPLDIEEYTSGLQEGSYEKWTTEMIVKAENRRRKNNRNQNRGHGVVRKSRYEQDEDEGENAKSKKERLQDLKVLLEKAEKVLVEKGSVPFKDKYPDKVTPHETLDVNLINKVTPATLQPTAKYEANLIANIKINYTKVTPQMGSRYLELFKAAWDGDAETIKALCFPRPTPAEEIKKEDAPKDTPSEKQDSDMVPKEGLPHIHGVSFVDPPVAKEPEPDTSKSPLLISATDSNNHNAFTIACYRKHSEEFLELLLNIAELQYEPKKKEDRNVMYRASGFRDDESDISEDSYDSYDEDRVHIMEQLVDEEITKDVLAAASEEVKASEDAFDTMFKSTYWYSSKMADAKTADSGEVAIAQPETGFLGDVMLSATIQNDLKLVKFLLRMNDTFGREKRLVRLVSPLDSGSIYTIGTQRDYAYQYSGAVNIAMKLGRIEILREFIRYEGLGLDKEEQQNAEKEEKPKYYQGIDVNGKKRKDWAASANPNASIEHHENTDPLLHYAAFHFNMQTCDWLMSPEPRMLLKEFGERLTKTNPEDKRIAIIREASDEKIKKWFGFGSDLLLHISLMSGVEEIGDASRSMRARYWLDKHPNLLEHKPIIGAIPPLILAVIKNDVELFKFLLDAGASPTIRDENGMNIIHYLTSDERAKPSEKKIMEQFLEAIPKDVRQTLFMQRGLINSGSYDTRGTILQTPLSFFLYGPSNLYRHNGTPAIIDKKELIGLMNKYSNGVDLHVRNGLGDTPLHTVTKFGDHASVEKLLELGGNSLLVEENANGFTSMELTDKQYISDAINDLDPNDNDIYGVPKYKRRPMLVPFGDERDRGGYGGGYYYESAFDVNSNMNNKDKDKPEMISLDFHKTWEILSEATKKCDKKQYRRKLIQLHEVTEVAKRLTDPEDRHNYYNPSTRYYGRRRYPRRQMHKGMEDEEKDDTPKSIFATHLASFAR